MAGPSTALSPVIAASTHWLVRAYPAAGADRAAATLAELQARLAVTAAARSAPAAGDALTSQCVLAAMTGESAVDGPAIVPPRFGCTPRSGASPHNLGRSAPRT